MGLTVFDSSGHPEPGHTIRLSGFTAGNAQPAWTMFQQRIDADLYTLEGTDLLKWRKEIARLTEASRVLTGKRRPPMAYMA